MQVLLIFVKKTLDKKNDQLLPEFKLKVNNGSCLQLVCSHLIFTVYMCEVVLLWFYNMLYDILNEF